MSYWTNCQLQLYFLPLQKYIQFKDSDKNDSNATTKAKYYT